MLGDVPASRQLRSQPLSIYTTGVYSAEALRLTGNMWTALIGRNSLREVPPDGAYVGVRARVCV